MQKIILFCQSFYFINLYMIGNQGTRKGNRVLKGIRLLIEMDPWKCD